MLPWEGGSKAKIGWKEKLSGREICESDLRDIWGVLEKTNAYGSWTSTWVHLDGSVQ